MLNLNFYLFLFIFEKKISICFDAAESGQLLFQHPATKIMDNLIDLHHDIFSVMLIIATIVFYLIVVAVLKFRSDNIFTFRNFNFTHNTFLEVFWTLIPMFILSLFLVPSFVLLYSMDELHDFLVTIKVIGRQWYWTYEYTYNKGFFLPKTIIFDSYLLADSDLPFGSFRLLEVDQRLRLPSHVYIRVLITSTDVLHSWAIPSCAVKMDACPGRLNQVSLNMYRFGVFYGQCSELCGANHGFMPIVIEGVYVKDYFSWLLSL